MNDMNDIKGNAADSARKPVNPVTPLKGTSVMGADDMRLKSAIVDTVRRVAYNYGYDEMETPVLSTRELLSFKFDDDAELLDELYKTSDRGNRVLGLRYDLTVPFARYVAENAKQLRFPFKRMEVGKVFRDGPVKGGRAREFTQCDCDVVGDGEPAATACDQMMLMADVFDALGMGDAIVRYSSRQLVNGILQVVKVPEDRRADVVRVLDKRDKLFDDDFERLLAETGLSEKQVRQLDEWMGFSLVNLSEYLAQCSLFDDPDLVNDDLYEGIQEMRELDSRLRAAYGDGYGERFVFTPSLVRGQDYYTGIVYEAYVDGFGSSVAGGGRYGSIIEDLVGASEDSAPEGRDMSASGLSFGIVPIMYVLREREERGGDGTGECTGDRDGRVGMTVITCSGNDVLTATRLVRNLRRGCRVELDSSERGVSKKIKSADKAGARYVVVFGEAERKGGMFSVKDMASGQELSFAVADAGKLDDDMLEAMFAG